MKRLAKTVLRELKRRVLSARRRLARRTVVTLHVAARRERRTPLLVRLTLAVYAVKRALQETAVRGWPLHRLRRKRWRREVETAFTMKLLRWARDPLDRPADAYPLYRLNNRVADADRREMRAAAEGWAHRPLVSVLVPVYNATPAWLDRLIASVVDQVYDRWELVLVDDASPNADVWPTLTGWAERDGRIVLERLPNNQGVSAATNRAAELASGEFLAFADHDDELTPDALWWMVEALQGPADADLVYSDEEVAPPEAPPYPMFKPGWSPELLVSFNYACHLAMVRRSAFDAAGGLRLGVDGAQDHDLLLRLSMVVRRVAHLPRILYRWHVGAESMSRRVEAKTGDVVAAAGIGDKTRRVVQDHLDRLGLDAEATIVSGWCVPRYRPTGSATASIIICTKDNADCLRAAVESIECKTAGPDHELLIVDTGAETAAARASLDEFAHRHRVLKYDGGGERFNWSRVNNWAAEYALGDVLVFLNDDVEVLEAGWLAALTAVARQPQVGAAGALLEYPDGRLQHAGVILGAHGWGPWHVLMGAKLRQPTDYQGIAYFQRNCLAVTGACLAIRRDLFEDVGGFDDAKLAVGFSDVDLCVRLHRRGLRNAYVPQARLIHKEGQSRGMRIDATEAAELASRTGGLVDPYWSPNFTRETHVPTISSRRRATGLRFADGVRALAVCGEESLDGGPAVDVLEVLRIVGRPSRGRLAKSIAESAADVVIAVGWDAAPAVKAAAAAGIPSLWHLPRRPLLEGRFSPRTFRQFAQRWRALDLPYQTVFPDLHSRAWLQAGWMRPNARVVERVVPGKSTDEIGTHRRERRRRFPDDAWVVAIEATAGEPEPLACLAEALELLDDSLRKRIKVLVCNEASGGCKPPGSTIELNGLSRGLRPPLALGILIVDGTLDDLAAADVFVAQPFRHLRSETPLTALAYGVPIIGSRYLEHADLMHVGVTGLQVSELDPRSLADALQELLPDEPRRQEMGQQSRAWLASRASCRWVQGEWNALLEEAAELGVGRPDVMPAEVSARLDAAAGAGESDPASRGGILTTWPNDRS